MPLLHEKIFLRAPGRCNRSSRLLGSLLFALALSIGGSAPSYAELAQAHPAPLLQYLPVGSQCRGNLPCETSGNYGIHFRVLGELALDDQHVVRSGLLVPSLILSALEIGECGAAFPMRFYALGLPVPERLRLFCKVSLPKSILPTSGGAVFVNVNLSTGPFDEAAAPSGARATTVDVGGALGGSVGSLIYLGAALWTTLGEDRPQLHAGPQLRLRTDYVTLFVQALFYGSVGASQQSAGAAWGLLGTFGMSFSSAVAPTSAHVSLGRGEAAPAMLIALEGGITYDVKVRDRYGDGIKAAERRWDRWVTPLRYRMRLRKLGYYDPYPDDNGFLRDDLDHSILGILGVPDPNRPGYILTPSGLSIPVGASLEIRGDRPFVASPAFPGRVLSYVPLQALTQDGGTMTQPILDELYFSRLEAERRIEERAVQEELRQLNSPWAKAALNAAAGMLTEPLLMFLAAASPATPDLATLRRQARLLPYRPGYEEYKGELAESVLATYGSLLGPWAAGTLRAAAALTAREAAAGLAGLRARVALDAAGHPLRLLSRLPPQLNPLNYRFELRGLGSNLGNVNIRYAEAAIEEAVAPAEHLQPPELGVPPLSDDARAHIYFGDVNKGKSTGWHYEPSGDATQGTYVIESTRSAPDANGVYKANVFIQGVKKNALSTFFPANWSQAEVENAIEQAYSTRQPERKPGLYTGYTDSGIPLQMELDKKGRISTTYPVYQGGM